MLPSGDVVSSEEEKSCRVPLHQLLFLTYFVTDVTFCRVAAVVIARSLTSLVSSCVFSISVDGNSISGTQARAGHLSFLSYSDP